LGQVRILTLDKKNFLRRISEDPTLAFRMIETMSRRIRDLSQQLAELKTRDIENKVNPKDFPDE